jgi:glycosidase
LYQFNTRVWLNERSRQLGRRATLDDLPDTALDEFVRQGFDWIWLLSVWQTGLAARAISRSNPVWRHEFQQTLPDLTDADIAGSGFAISGYRVHRSLGGNSGLARLRKRMQQRGLKLMLDFVPNHMAPDHPWVTEHPEYFVSGTDEQLAAEPQNYSRVETTGGERILACGRDPYFPGWSDTLQLNYGQPELQQAMREELLRIAGQCDGVRCDMAMLILPEVFQRTWGIAMEPFWPGTIAAVKQAATGFVFMAEVYWDLEWTLQQQGFDYCYDKRLYDRLRGRCARPVREHLLAGLDYQDHLARFLENHDEPRAAATFSDDEHRAAAVITFLVPGLRFFHQGQTEGRRVRISPHLVRAPDEPVNDALAQFYSRLLDVLRRPVVRDGDWKLVDANRAWEGNDTHDNIVAFVWQHPCDGQLIVAVNYAGHPGQARLRLPFELIAAATVTLRDLLSGHVYERSSDELNSAGLFVDLPAWGTHVLSVEV